MFSLSAQEYKNGLISRIGQSKIISRVEVIRDNCKTKKTDVFL